jgi:hypothetical protein
MTTAQKKKLKKARELKAKSDALVWRETPGVLGGHVHAEAPATWGRYNVRPAYSLPDNQFHGYHVKHLPHGTNRDARSVAKNIKDVDKAKALAQADHDAGNDAK